MQNFHDPRRIATDETLMFCVNVIFLKCFHNLDRVRHALMIRIREAFGKTGRVCLRSPSISKVQPPNINLSFPLRCCINVATASNPCRCTIKTSSQTINLTCLPQQFSSSWQSTNLTCWIFIQCFYRYFECGMSCLTFRKQCRGDSWGSTRNSDVTTRSCRM